MPELFPYQKEGVAFLATRNRALLTDKPGLGKTAQAVRAADCVLDDHEHMVVICPASLTENWNREINNWRQGFWTATVLSYDALVRGADVPPHAAVVLDEAHYCKSAGAKRTKAALRLAQKAKHAWALTGTPAVNGVHELYTLLRVFAAPVVTGKNGKIATYLQFINRYCTTVPNPFGYLPKVTGTKNGAELKARLSQFMLRRAKEEVLKDLPPMVEANMFVTVDEDDLKGLRKLEREIGPHALGQVAAGNLRALDGEDVATLRRLTGTIKAGALAKMLDEELAEGLEKIVVFAHHRDVLDVLHKALHHHGLVRLDGSATLTARQAAVDAFQTDPKVKVFLGQITAAGVGLTLTAAQSAVFAEMSWVPAENAQAKDRIHRIGQTGSCLVRYAILPRSLDERIVGVLRKKTAAIAQVIT